jgi:histidyl-tRNA synthetase
MQSPRGTKDIFAPEIASWHAAESAFRSITNRFGYTEIRTPIFESTDIFKRAIGENTDVVGKEMYTFPDRGGDSLTLRPEATASVVRAAIQHNLTAQQQLARLWYCGPFFRYERPQKGRQRQFHQFGAELMGSARPEADAEIIVMACEILHLLQIQPFTLQINTLANQAVRQQFKQALVEYLQEFRNELSEDSRIRLERNPLRVLDSKNPDDKKIIAGAPALHSFMDAESTDHFQSVQSMLNEQNIAYTIQPALVRGLDYYSHTVFEFTSSLLGAQDALGGGGRYNDMFEHFGGKNTPCVGFACGIERLLLAMEATQSKPAIQGPDIYCIAFDSEQARSMGRRIAMDLRRKGKNVIMDVQARSIKAQMREADKVQAHYALIIGPEEIQNQSAIIKNLREGNGTQQAISFDNIVDFFA